MPKDDKKNATEKTMQIICDNPICNAINFVAMIIFKIGMGLGIVALIILLFLDAM